MLNIYKISVSLDSSAQLRHDVRLYDCYKLQTANGPFGLHARHAQPRAVALCEQRCGGGRDIAPSLRFGRQAAHAVLSALGAFAHGCQRSGWPADGASPVSGARPVGDASRPHPPAIPLLPLTQRSHERVLSRQRLALAQIQRQNAERRRRVLTQRGTKLAAFTAALALAIAHAGLDRLLLGRILTGSFCCTLPGVYDTHRIASRRRPACPYHADAYACEHDDRAHPHR